MELLAKHMPFFERAAYPSDDADLYSWAVSSDLTCYLLLFFFPGKDKFNIEVAWSKKGRFPIHLIGRILRDGPQADEIRFRISDLWKSDMRTDEWWTLRREPTLGELEDAIRKKKAIPIQRIDNAKEMIESMVEDAVDKVRNYVVPYFQNVLGD